MTEQPEPSGMNRLIAELKRRRVFKVTVWYAMAAFVLLQLGEIILPAFVDMRPWEDFWLRVLVLLLLMGFPVVIFLAWVFDITPHGIERTETTEDGRPLVSPMAALLIRSVTIVVSAAVMVAGGSWVLRAAPDTTGPILPPNARVEPPAIRSADLAPPMGDDRTSIAVLPFENRSGEDGDDAFADGIQEDILTQLAKIADLRVLGRNAVLPYRDQDVNARQIGQELGVETVLLGSVRWQGDQIRISTQLVDTQTEEQLWAETYDRQLDDVFAVQTEVARNIADALQLELSPTEVTQLASRPTENVDAFLGYRDVVRHLDVLEEDAPAATIDSLIGLTDSVMELDPEFAAVYLTRASLFNRLGDSVSIQRAEEELERALELNPELGDVVSVIGSDRFYFDPESMSGGERMAEVFSRDEGRRRGGGGLYDAAAISLSGRGVVDEVTALLAQGQREEAQQILATVRETAPENVTPYAWEIQIALSQDGDVGTALEVAEDAFTYVRPDRVLSVLNQHPTLIREGDFESVILSIPLRDGGGPRSAIASSRYDVLMARGHQLRITGDAAGATARYDSAAVIARQLPGQGPATLFRDLRVAEALAYAGRGAEAVQVVSGPGLDSGSDRLEGIRASPERAMQWARVLAIAGESDRAISELELLSARFPEIVSPTLLLEGEQWDSLRDDPRFQQLVRPEPE